MIREHGHEWTRERLSDYLAESLAPDDLEAVRAHLSACASCRSLRDDIQALAAAARALPPIEPSSDLWPGILRAIDGRSGGPGTVDGHGAEVVALRPRTMESSDAREPSRTGGRSLLSSRPALAAAAVVLVAISGSLAWWGRGAVDGDSVAAAGAAATALPVRAVGLSESPVNPRLAGELERLESVVEEARGRLDANTIQVLERNLVLVERAIEDSYRALALDPENEFVREHLERSYQRKADFLRDVSRMAEIAG